MPLRIRECSKFLWPHFLAPANQSPRSGVFANVQSLYCSRLSCIRPASNLRGGKSNQELLMVVADFERVGFGPMGQKVCLSNLIPCLILPLTYEQRIHRFEKAKVGSPFPLLPSKQSSSHPDPFFLAQFATVGCGPNRRWTASQIQMHGIGAHHKWCWRTNRVNQLRSVLIVTDCSTFYQAPDHCAGTNKQFLPLIHAAFNCFSRIMQKREDSRLTQSFGANMRCTSRTHDGT